ncbi:MAG TPA: hypothetical protein VF384_06970 [Planctomycetota bacterium]
MALLNSIGFRADRWSATAIGAQVPNVTVTLSQTSVGIGALSSGFASNVTGQTTVVFQGIVTLPAQGTGLAGPQPWNIAIPFSQPFSFVTVLGNLLIDIVGNNPISGTPSPTLDAVRAGGTATQFGVAESARASSVGPRRSRCRCRTTPASSAPHCMDSRWSSNRPRTRSG